ncbi:hypothetical protein N0V94_007376 [Neodidymelliopsis sp. IMI 364377]|nr:hypothetical protein N0V94_007376 [Neodidymelliopsis sp. IMI 364377]
MALRLGTRTTAVRAAVVLPTKEASMGLRNFATATRNVGGLRQRHQTSAVSVAAQVVQRRWISERGDGRGRLYEFEDVCCFPFQCSSGLQDPNLQHAHEYVLIEPQVLSILEDPSDSRLLIDVREPHEFGANTIPTAINLPVTSHPDALLLPPDEFQDQFGFAKPPTNKEVVFFCKAGVRSSSAAGIARQAGYTNVGEYKGSWAEWEKRGGPGTKSPPAPGGVGERTGPVTETKIAGGKTSGEEDIGTQGVPQPPKGGEFGTQ